VSHPCRQRGVGRAASEGLPEGAAGVVVQEAVKIRDTATVHPLAASAGPGGEDLPGTRARAVVSVRALIGKS
jgi:hypothetical protein